MVQTLKIYSSIAAIVKMVQSNQVTIVSTPTGSGKTILVPISLNHFLGAKVFVTVPRRFLAENAARTVFNLVVHGKTPIGTLTKRVKQNLNAGLVYCTEGSFLNYNSLKSTDILVIDEIHEQGIRTEEVILAAKQHIVKGGKVVLMSATMDISKYNNYFGGNAAVMELPESERQFVCETIQTTEYNVLDKFKTLDGITLWGVGGKDDIEQVTRKLRDLDKNIITFPFHGEIEEEEEAEMLNYMKSGEPCVIVATSVAMSGVTLPNLKNVIVPVYGKRVENGVLVDYVLSQAEARQWAGRVGRTSEGVVVHQMEMGQREPNPLPEILRVPVMETYFSLLGRTGLELDKVQLLNQPNPTAIATAKQTLEKSGLITEGCLTFKGEQVFDSGEGIYSGCFLYEGAKLGIENTAAKIAAVIQQGNPFRRWSYRPSKIKMSDLATLSQHLKVIELIENNDELDYNFNPDLYKFCKENNIYLKGVKMLKRQFERIDRQFTDRQILNKELLFSLFKAQTADCLFNYGQNCEGKYVAFCQSALQYSNLQPNTRNGRHFADLTTVLD